MATVADLRVAIGADVGDFDKAMKGVQRSLDQAGKKMVSMGKTMSVALTAPIAALGVASVAAFDKQAKAEGKLRAALQANGREVGKLFSDYQTFAQELQKVTTIGDEATLQLLQVAESMGLSGEAAKTAAKEAIAMEAALGISEQSAIRYTAALAAGDATMLKRYLPALRGIEDQAEMTAKAHELLGNMFGAATSQAQVGLGPLKQLQNQFGDLTEEAGAVIAEALLPMIDVLKGAVTWMQKLSPSAKAAGVAIGAIAAAAGPALMALGLMTSGFGSVLTMLPKLIAGVKALSLAMTATPWGAIAAAIGLVVAAVVAFKMEAIAVRDELGKLNATGAEEVFVKIERGESLMTESTKDVAAALEQARSQLIGTQKKMGDFEAATGTISIALIEEEGRLLNVIDALDSELTSRPKVTKAIEDQTKALEGLHGEMEREPGATEKVERKESGPITSTGGGDDAPSPLGDILLDVPEQANKALSAMDLFKQGLWRVGDAARSMADTTNESFNAVMNGVANTANIISEMAANGFNTTTEKIGAALSVATEVVGVIGQIYADQAAQEEERIDSQLQKQIEAVNQSKLSEEAKQKKIVELTEKAEKKKTKARSKAAKQQKAIAIAEAVINTAAAIVSALAGPWPASIAFAVMAGAMGAAQIAMISSQSIPGYADGGMNTTPGMAMLHGTRSSPEIIVPSKNFDQLNMGGKQQVAVMDVRISGEDIILVQRKVGSRGFFTGTE